jgi:hypothetical protein
MSSTRPLSAKQVRNLINSGGASSKYKITNLKRNTQSTTSSTEAKYKFDVKYVPGVVKLTDPSTFTYTLTFQLMPSVASSENNRKINTARKYVT